MNLYIVIFFFIFLKKISYLFFALALSYIIYNGDILSAFNIKLIFFSLLYDIFHSFFIKKIFINPIIIKKFLSSNIKTKKFDLLYFNFDEISNAISYGIKSFLSVFLGFILLFLFWLIIPFYSFIFNHYFYNLMFLITFSFLINCYSDSKLLINKVVTHHDEKGYVFLKTFDLLKYSLPNDQLKSFMDNASKDFFNEYKISDLRQLDDNWLLKRKFTVHIMRYIDAFIKEKKI